MTDSAPIHVAAFAGSLRRTSMNRGLIRAAAEVAPPGMTVQILELDELPLYNADMEARGTPAPVRVFQQAVAAADALLIATPEYNYSISGVLKNALDWASRRLGPDMPPAMQGKPTAIMGSGGRFGTVRAQSHLRYILVHNDIKVLNNPQIMLVRAGQSFDADGNVIDEALRVEVRDLLDALYTWTLQLRK